MATTQVFSNVSSDLVWEITRFNNSFLVKRTSAGGIQLSRDPLNLSNKNSRKYAGYANEKAIGIQQESKGAIRMISKKPKQLQRPASNLAFTTFRGDRSGPKLYKSIASATAKQGYRPDLREDAVSRASALRHSSKPLKDIPEKKPRGAKARKVV